MNKIVTSLTLVLLAVLLVGPSLTHAQSSHILLGSTNRGDLVEIDLAAGTVQLIGNAPSPGGWTDLAMDPAGNLYAVSRWRSEPNSVCFGVFSAGKCAHLYRLDPNTGAVLEHIGDLQAAAVSDIDFAGSGILYGSRYVDTLPQDDGGLVTIDPADANITVPPNIRFGSLMENGGLAVHPLTGDLWAIESSFAIFTGASVTNIFKVDPSTGLAIPPVVPLGIFGQPADFTGFDGLEILPDGRFIATTNFQPRILIEIKPDPMPESGLAETMVIRLTFDPAILGQTLNGLTSPTAAQITVAIDIKPGSDPNGVNPTNNGLIPVAVLGSMDFDASLVNPTTVLFGLNTASPAHNGHIEDVNSDGFLDILFHFRTIDTGIACGDMLAGLSGATAAGDGFAGTDAIMTTGCN